MQRIYSLLPLLALMLVFTGCIEEKCEELREFTGFEPVFVTADDWRASSFICGIPEPICEATSFYVYQDYLFMVEANRGLHILDNSDASNPTPITFMQVPGGQGLAVRNDILYINQYTDLVAFDLSNPELPELVGRTEDVFEPYSVFAQVLPGDQFVSDWLPTNESRVVDCQSANFGLDFFFEGGIGFARDESALFANANAVAGADFAGQNGGSGETVGQGGSLARFTITQGNLYAVDDSRLKAFSLADPMAPVFTANIELGWGVETIFPTADKLFIGTTTGMHIYGLDDPLNPEHLSTFEHVLACDPVVVSGDLAYVTLWGGRDCGSVGDQLEIIDVSDPRNPESVQITPMSNSHGLSVAEGKLFLCSTWEGLKVFDLDDEGLLGDELSTATDINARDVIVLPHKNEAIVLGYYQEGIQQYQYTDDGQLTPTSRISVCQE